MISLSIKPLYDFFLIGKTMLPSRVLNNRDKPDTARINKLISDLSDPFPASGTDQS